MKLIHQLFWVITLSCVSLSCTTDDTSIIDPIDVIIGGGDAVLGSGTANDPYQLSTAQHLDVFMRNSLASSYVLNKDIDVSVYIAENYPTDGWLPINGFEGVLDGAGFTIAGLSINRPESDDIGFFGTLGNGSNSNTVTIEIKNLTIGIAASGTVTGLSKVGALVGNADDGLRISNVHVIGGDADSQVLSTETTNTTDLGRSGGLIGLADRCTIIQCSSAIKVVSSGAGRIGGLAGMVNTTVVDQCYATGDVYAQFEDVGGLLGYAHNPGTSVTNSYSTGDIYITGASTDDIGSFIGSTHSSFVPLNCYATGNITLAATSIGTYGYFSGDGDGGSGIFGATTQNILNGASADISSGSVAESSGFALIDLASSNCADFSAFDTSIWSCNDGSFPNLINNP